MRIQGCLPWLWFLHHFLVCLGTVYIRSGSTSRSESSERAQRGLLSGSVRTQWPDLFRLKRAEVGSCPRPPPSTRSSPPSWRCWQTRRWRRSASWWTAATRCCSWRSRGAAKRTRFCGGNCGSWSCEPPGRARCEPRPPRAAPRCCSAALALCRPPITLATSRGGAQRREVTCSVGHDRDRQRAGLVPVRYRRQSPHRGVTRKTLLTSSLMSSMKDVTSYLHF